MSASTLGTGRWTRVCAVERIVPDTGVTALIGGIQVAVFRLSDGRVFAIGNHDPCTTVNVLSRGIVGDLEGRPFVASPIHKQRFDLATGRCLDRDDLEAGSFTVRVVDGVVEVAVSSAGAG